MQIYIHIGYPKTGSTYLQEKVFNKLDDFYFIGKTLQGYELKGLSEIFKKISLLRNDDYDSKKTELIEIFKNYVKTIDKSKLIISDEAFLNCLSFHTRKNPNKFEIYKTIKRLNDFFMIFGEVKFLFLIRRHKDMLKSYITHFITDMKFNFEEEDLLKILLNDQSKFSFILKSFNYGDLNNYFKENYIQTKLIFYEDFINDKETLFNELSDFLNCNNRLNYRNFDAEKVNYEITKKNYFYHLWFHLKRIYMPTLHNLNKYKFNLGKYYEKLIHIKRIFFPSKIKKINMNNYEKLIKKYYLDDLNKLPENIKIKCKKYNYF